MFSVVIIHPIQLSPEAPVYYENVGKRGYYPSLSPSPSPSPPVPSPSSSPQVFIFIGTPPLTPSSTTFPPMGSADIQSFMDYLFHAHQPHSIPTSNEYISSLPLLTISQSLLHSSPKCPICLDDFHEEEQALSLPCNHIFHPSDECVKTWLKTHNTCPVCRYELPVDDPKEEEARKKRMSEKHITDNNNNCDNMEIITPIHPESPSLSVVRTPSRSENVIMQEAPHITDSNSNIGTNSSGLKRGFLLSPQKDNNPSKKKKTDNHNDKKENVNNNNDDNNNNNNNDNNNNRNNNNVCGFKRGFLL